jgi:hypothetical protein
VSISRIDASANGQLAHFDRYVRQHTYEIAASGKNRLKVTVQSRFPDSNRILQLI